MILPRPAHQEQPRPTLRRRDGAPNSQVAIAVVVSVLIVLAASIFVYAFLRSLRKRGKSPKYLPAHFLKKRWNNWNPGSSNSNKVYNAQRNSSAPTLLGQDGHRSNRASQLDLPDVELARAENGSGAEVDRHTSVRSIMTLPAYSRSVRENERILGREGERAGIDVVVEAPETNEEEEERREEEMESLYQIRVQRRREATEREERRNERREARDRGDHVTLQRLRHESRLRAEERTIETAAAMIAEHQSHSRERRVSSVSYAELGVARHDGSRVRDSNDSYRPLLNDAASIGGGSMRPWSTSNSLSVHQRDPSAGSVLSLSDDGSELDAPPFGRAGSDFEVVALNHPHSRNGSRQLTPVGTRSRASSNSTNGPPPIDTSTEVPIGEEPPSYSGGGFEEAPPYTSPISERASQVQPTSQHDRAFSVDGAPLLPTIDRLPSIRIAEASTSEPDRGQP